MLISDAQETEEITPRPQTNHHITNQNLIHRKHTDEILRRGTAGERERERETDRQTGRQTDTQTGRLRERPTEREKQTD